MSEFTYKLIVTKLPEYDASAAAVMVHLYLCLPDRCGQKKHKSKGDRQCKIGQKENVCLFCSYVFSVRTGQADRGINAP